MRRAALLLPIVVGTVLLGSSAASSGGWWTSISFSEEYLVTGELARGHTERLRVGRASPMLHTGDIYYVYLIRDLDWSLVDQALATYPPGDWWQRPERAMRVGEVVLREGIRVDVEFQVPDVAPGRYAVMVCDLGCVQPMGASIPSRVTVVDSPQAAVLSRRLDRVRDRAAARVAKVRRNLTSDIYGVQDFSASEHELEYLRDRVVRLEDGLAKISAREPVVRTDWRPVIVTGLMGLAAALVLARRRRIEVLVPVTEPEGKEATRV